MIPDLEMWRCFEAAATFRTFRQAAKELSLSMRMFEYRIKRLELALGAALFIRAYGRAILTAEGERMLPQAFRMLDQAAELGRARDQVPRLELTVGAQLECRRPRGADGEAPGRATLALSAPSDGPEPDAPDGTAPT